MSAGASDRCVEGGTCPMTAACDEALGCLGPFRWQNVGICDDCWEAENPGRTAARLAGGTTHETCIDCGALTRSGIYVRRFAPVSAEASR